MAKQKISITEEEVQSDLAAVLADSLNKKFKATNHKVAYFLEGDDD